MQQAMQADRLILQERNARNAAVKDAAAKAKELERSALRVAEARSRSTSLHMSLQKAQSDLHNQKQRSRLALSGIHMDKIEVDPKESRTLVTGEALVPQELRAIIDANPTSSADASSANPEKRKTQQSRHVSQKGALSRHDRAAQIEAQANAISAKLIVNASRSC